MIILFEGGAKAPFSEFLSVFLRGWNCDEDGKEWRNRIIISCPNWALAFIEIEVVVIFRCLPVNEECAKVKALNDYY